MPKPSRPFFRTAFPLATLLLPCGCRTLDDSGRTTALPGSAAEGPDSAASGSLLRALTSHLRKVNPSITDVDLHDLARLPAPDSSSYVVVALGHGIHRGWSETRQVGEIFGIFGIDSAFDRVTRVYGVFPTARLGDYRVIFADQTFLDSIVVLGKGATYGDNPTRRVYPR